MEYHLIYKSIFPKPYTKSIPNAGGGYPDKVINILVKHIIPDDPQEIICLPKLDKCISLFFIREC